MKISSIILKVLMPLILGGAILYWMYRGEDWQQIRHVMTDEMDWTWHPCPDVPWMAMEAVIGAYR